MSTAVTLGLIVALLLALGVIVWVFSAIAKGFTR